MIFARYKGASRNGFTPGKTYIGKPELEDQSVVFSGFIEIVDDHGVVARVNPEKEQFEYLEEVYVVVVHSFEGVAVGDVLVVDDADDYRKHLNVKGYGYRAVCDLVILDRTNVFPGVMVCESSTGKWVKISRVDEALWVSPEGGDRMRSPEEFSFAVSEVDGEIMTEPLAMCMMTRADETVTAGRRYYLLQSKDDMVWVQNDLGVVKGYFRDRFRIG